MKFRIFISIPICILLLLSVTWFWQILWTIALALVWKKGINEVVMDFFERRFAKAYGFFQAHNRLAPATSVVCLLLVALFYVAPRYRVDCNDRVRLIYQDTKGNPIHPPLHHYLLNCFVQEGEIEGIATKLTSVIPYKLLRPICQRLHIGFRFIEEYEDCGLSWRESTQYYRELESEGCFTMSGCAAQTANIVLGTKTRSVYLILPEDYDESREYPLLVFMHGYLGNWQMYAGMLKDMKNCVVLCAGTDDLSGIFHSRDIERIFKEHKHFLEQMGVKVDWNRAHLAGLSNGGTATYIAHASYGNRFRSITYISTDISSFSSRSAAIYLIGGGKDPSSTTLLPGYHRLKRNGVDCDIYWNEHANHFVMMTDWNDIREWLNKKIE